MKDKGTFTADEIEMVSRILAAKCEDDLTTLLSASLASDRRPKLGYDTTPRARSAMQAVRIAEEECRPILGSQVVAFDSASGIYGAALRALGHDTNTTPGHALEGLYHGLKRNGMLHQRPGQQRPVPSSAAASSFDKMFPGAVKLTAI
jgi:hypothetical protein